MILSTSLVSRDKTDLPIEREKRKRVGQRAGMMDGWQERGRDEYPFRDGVLRETLQRLLMLFRAADETGVIGG